MPASRLTAQEFDALLPRLSRMTAETVDIARKVLVDGVAQAAIVKEHALSKQRVSQLISRVLGAVEEVPSDWVRVEVWLPPNVAQWVERLGEEERAKLTDNAA